MSLTGAGPWSRTGMVVPTAISHNCFFCGDPTTDPAVIWCGETGEIYLHPGCCADLAIRLFRDLHELQRATGNRFGERR